MAVTEMTERELWYAAITRVGPQNTEPEEVAALRRFTHAEMAAGHIDGATQDRIGELIDAIAVKSSSKVGDIIGPNAADIPWDVIEFTNNEGDRWRRAFGEDHYAIEDLTGRRDYSQEYDWVTVGGWSTTSGALAYAPLIVVRVVKNPNEEEI